MTIQISKAFLLTLAAIALVTIGAVGAWAVNKAITPTVIAPSQPAPQATAAAVTVPTTIAAPIAVVPAVTPVVPGARTTPTTETATTSEIKSQPATERQAPAATTPQTLQPTHFLAEIVKVRRHYIKKTIPYRHCFSEPRSVFVEGNGPSGIGAVLGGVTGGVLGNQVGQGRGNVAATVGGAVLGAVAGHQVESNMDRPEEHVVYERICETRYRNESIPKGYEVTYLDRHNKARTIITKRAPTGDTISIPIASDGKIPV